MADSKVKATVAHNQVIDGKPYKPGDTVSLDGKLAKVLANRGAVQINEAVKASPSKAAADADAGKKEASK
ncbi:hypothetical protein GCM10009592_28690 [Brachybacterium rhamnosum]|uniref:Uncharacterized protein n=1 Tax=Brachybacterium rhamnosum TaxID=173361 RepID=A0ABW4Q3X6_9MICO